MSMHMLAMINELKERIEALEKKLAEKPEKKTLTLPVKEKAA
jgi:hypothetical protein